jgi:hypothetical protein
MTLNPDDYDHKCKTAGNSPSNELTISCGTHRCGRIMNGVAFRFETRGAWVLSYDDLKAAYEMATKAREAASNAASNAVKEKP